MVKRWEVNKRTASMSWIEAVELTALGGKPRPDFAAGARLDRPAVEVKRLLCCFCREYHSPAEVEKCMVLPRKADVKGGSESSTSRSLVAGPLSGHSELWGFLTATAYSDGLKRRTGRLSVSCESGLLRLSLNDDETGSYATLTGFDLQSLLDEAELRLADGSLSFKVSKWSKGKK